MNNKYSILELVDYLNQEIKILEKRLAFFKDFSKKDSKTYQETIDKLTQIKDLIKNERV